MRILALDVGEKRIGLALSDPLGLTAQRLALLTCKSRSRDIEAIRILALENKVEEIVIGMPLTMGGKKGPQAQRVIAFAHALHDQVNVPVRFVDERLTTAQGERALLETDTSRRARKLMIDQVAAQLILQYYLDSEHKKGSF